MKWTGEAETAIKKVPFFVRKKVRLRVEGETAKSGKTVVSLSDVKAIQARFLNKMSSEVKGYQLDICFGPNGCPNRANIGDGLVERLEAVLKQEDLHGFLKNRVKGELKFHHDFRVTVSECPNACSQPQIKDVGILGAEFPRVTDDACTLCEACVHGCREMAIELKPEEEKPEIDLGRCVGCGQCIHVCPTGTLAMGQKGFRVQLGGKLGRHPRLARELPGIYSVDEVVEIVKKCIQFFKKNSRSGERFAEIFGEADFENMVEAIK
jgi:anaerobic sulfite reductase subunit C